MFACIARHPQSGKIVYCAYPLYNIR